MTTENEMTIEEAASTSRISALVWGEGNADLLCSFNGEKLNKRLFSLFSTTHRANQPISYGELSAGFLRLLDSKVLLPECPISGIAAEQLDDMRARFGPQTVPSVTSAPPTPSDPNDFSQMTQAQFDGFSSADSKRLYKSNRSFPERADYLWAGGSEPAS